MLFIRYFSLALLCGFMQYGKAAQVSKPITQTAPKIEAGFFSRVLSQFKPKQPSVAAATQKLFPEQMSSNEHGLFSAPLSRSTQVSTLEEHVSNEDALFSSSLPSQRYPYFEQFKNGQENHGDNPLFYNPLTQNSKSPAQVTRDELRNKYELKFFPYEKQLATWANHHADVIKTGLQEKPYSSLIYGAAGAGFGFGSGLFSNYFNTKTFQWASKTPSLEGTNPKLFKYLKWLTSPKVRAAIPIKSAGKVCLVAIGIAAEKLALEDGKTFLSTVSPTLKNLKEDTCSFASNTTEKILSIGDYLTFSPDGAIPKRE